MSDASDPHSSAPPVTNPAGGTGMTGGGPLQWEPPTVGDAARLFPNYEILALIGRGGMGAVYKARQIALDRLVAIKLLPLEVSVNRDFADRFVREARTMAKLSHPNIIAVHDFGTTSEGHLFFVMEFVAGANLHSIIHEVGLDPDQALYLAGEVCAALAYAHGRGVVHRDIKPANVMVDGDSKVKVADFGLARLTDVNPEMHGMTMTGMVMGTPDYMAPEQKRGMNVDARADIYSVGVMLYEMVCREVPQGAFDLPSRRTGCDPRLDAIVLKAMNQSAERRYQSTKEMEAALEAARKPMSNALVPQPHAVPHALAVAPRPGMPVAAPRPAAPLPRYAAQPAVTAELVKSRTPLYAGIAAAVVAIGVIVMALPKSQPKLAEERAQSPNSAANEAPSANTSAPKPAPTPDETRGGARVPPTAETPKEKPAANAPESKPAPPPTPEPPKEPPVAATPEMKPKPEPAPVPPPADAPQQSATAKWLAEQEPQWQAAFALEVTGACDKAAADLRKQYISSLDAQLANATRTGNLVEAVACRDELQRLHAGGTPGEDDAITPAGLKAMRAGFRKNLAVLETDRAAKAKAVHARYDATLAQNQTLLTQRQRLDEALLLKAKRDELAAAWLKPSPLPSPAPTTPGTSAQPVVTSPGMKFGTAQIAAATKERPFENSLGMRFVPVPGTGVLLSIWETRVKDYAAYAQGKAADDSWTKQQKDGVPVGREPEHPVCGMSWDDANAFCEWLTKTESDGGKLPKGMKYRLPTDEEWSRAVGLPKEAGATPKERHRKNTVDFPWGTDFPPKAKAGNYADSTWHEKFPKEKVIEGYTDGYATTAPVGSFAPNRHGIYDLGGNVYEWCEDLWEPGSTGRLFRGASWGISDRLSLLSSNRVQAGAGDHIYRTGVGFRVVVSAAGPSPGNARPAANTSPNATGQIAAELIGSWLFRWNRSGWETIYTFNADGTYTGKVLTKPGSESGTWRFAEDKFIVEGPGGDLRRTIFLPIDPKGTKVRDKRKNDAIIATRQ